MHEFLLIDGVTKEVLERHFELDQARQRRVVLQAARGARVRIQKTPLPDPPPEPVNNVRTGTEAQRYRTISTVGKLDLSDGAVDAIVQLGFTVGSDQSLRELTAEALALLAEREGAGPWNRDAYRQIRRNHRATPSSPESAPTINSRLAELAVVRVLAQTYPYNQFSVTPQGDVFVGNQFGHHQEVGRLYVTTLSPILDEAADLLLNASLGEGGRFYVHPRAVERAGDNSLLARLNIIDHHAWGSDGAGHDLASPSDAIDY